MGRSPSPNGPNGGTSGGQFAKGNPGGPGNPYAKRVAALRRALLEQVQEKDVRAIAAKLVRLAKDGDIAAAKEVLDRLMGKAQQSIDVQLESFEETNSHTNHSEEMVAFINDHARLMIPKRAWVPGVLRQYEAWRQGYRPDTRPKDFDAIVERVESRCNWIRMTPEAAADCRTATILYDGKSFRLDTERLTGA